MSKCIFNQFSCIKVNRFTKFHVFKHQFSDGYFYHIFNVKDDYKKILKFATLTSKNFWFKKTYQVYTRQI